MKEIVFSKNAPPPIGPYSQAIKASGNFLFVSGQIPFTGAGELAGEDIKTQTHQSIKNIIAILDEAGLNVNNIVKCTVLLKSMNDFATVNEIYNEYFGESKPARIAYEVSRLPKDVLVEIDAIAVY